MANVFQRRLRDRAVVRKGVPVKYFSVRDFGKVQHPGDFGTLQNQTGNQNFDRNMGPSDPLVGNVKPSERRPPQGHLIFDANFECGR